jgi:hypothetical protein
MCQQCPCGVQVDRCSTSTFLCCRRVTHPHLQKCTTVSSGTSSSSVNNQAIHTAVPGTVVHGLYKAPQKLRSDVIPRASQIQKHIRMSSALCPYTRSSLLIAAEASHKWTSMSSGIFPGSRPYLRQNIYIIASTHENNGSPPLQRAPKAPPSRHALNRGNNAQNP